MKAYSIKTYIKVIGIMSAIVASGCFSYKDITEIKYSPSMELDHVHSQMIEKDNCIVTAIQDTLSRIGSVERFNARTHILFQLDESRAYVFLLSERNEIIVTSNWRDCHQMIVVPMLEKLQACDVKVVITEKRVRDPVW